MATTKEYLSNLEKDKSNLVNNLQSKGISASTNETFTQLVPKVKNIENVEDYFNLNPTLTYDTGNTGENYRIFDYFKKLPKIKLTKPKTLYRFCDNFGNGYCSNGILDLSNLDVSAMTSLDDCFYITQTNTLNVTGWDCSNITSADEVFEGARINNLVGTLQNLGKSFSNGAKFGISETYNPTMPREVIVSLLNGLYDVSSQGKSCKVVTVNSVINLLTSSDKLIATNKGWTISNR